MRIYFKNKEEFVRLIFTKGYNLSTLSNGIGRCRQYNGQSLKNGSLGTKPAIAIAELLEVDYDDIFEIK